MRPTAPATTDKPGGGKPLQQYSIRDFSGGLVTNYPDNALAQDQFKEMLNFYIEPEGHLTTRGPYRPWQSALRETAIKDKIINTFWPSKHTEDIWLAVTDDGASVLKWFAPEADWEDWVDGIYAEGSQVKHGDAYWTADTGGAEEGEIPGVDAVWLSATGPNLDYRWDILTDGVSPVVFTEGRVHFADFRINEAVATIITNGKDKPHRLENNVVSELGLPAPVLKTTPATSATQTDASIKKYQDGLGFNAEYFYKITYFYADGTRYGESGASPSFSGTISGITDDGETATMDLADLPELPEGVTKGLIYRCRGNENGLYKNVGFYTGTTFTDTTPDNEEGAELESDVIAIPNLAFPVVMNGRIIAADPDVTGKVIWSDPGYPDIFRALSFYYLPDPITGMAIFNRDLYIFTEDFVYVVPKGDVTGVTEPLRVSAHGTVAHGSIVDVGTGLAWMGNDNVYWANFNTQAEDGDFALPIGDPIRDIVRSIQPDDRKSAVAVLAKDRYYLSLTTPFSPNGYNDHTLVWNIQAGMRLFRQGRSGAWSEVDWAATQLREFRGDLYTSGSHMVYLEEETEDRAEGGYIYEHNFPSSGVIHDYPAKWQLDNAVLGNFTVPNRGTAQPNPDYDPGDPESPETIDPPVIETELPLKDIVEPGPGFIGAALRVDRYDFNNFPVSIAHTASQLPSDGLSVMIWVYDTTQNAVATVRNRQLINKTVTQDHPTHAAVKLLAYDLAILPPNRPDNPRCVQWAVGHDWEDIEARLVAELPAIPMNEWMCIVANWDPTRMSIWINGALAAETEENIPAFLQQNDAGQPTLPLGIGRAFTGKIANAAQFTRPLTSAEIVWLYNGGQGRAELYGD